MSFIPPFDGDDSYDEADMCDYLKHSSSTLSTSDSFSGNARPLSLSEQYVLASAYLSSVQPSQPLSSLPPPPSSNEVLAVFSSPSPSLSSLSTSSSPYTQLSLSSVPSDHSHEPLHDFSSSMPMCPPPPSFEGLPVDQFSRMVTSPKYEAYRSHSHAFSSSSSHSTGLIQHPWDDPSLVAYRSPPPSFSHLFTKERQRDSIISLHDPALPNASYHPINSEESIRQHQQSSHLYHPNPPSRPLGLPLSVPSLLLPPPPPSRPPPLHPSIDSSSTSSTSSSSSSSFSSSSSSSSSHPSPPSSGSSTATGSSTAPSKRKAAGDVDRRLKHRLIDERRRKRETALVERFAWLSGQKEEGIQRDRVTTLEVACDRYEDLVENVEKMKAKMRRMENMLREAGRQVEEEEGGRKWEIEERLDKLMSHLHSSLAQRNAITLSSSSSLASSSLILISVSLSTSRNVSCNAALCFHGGWQEAHVIGKVCAPVHALLARMSFSFQPWNNDLKDRPPVLLENGVLAPMQVVRQRPEVDLSMLSVMSGDRERAETLWRTPLMDGRIVEMYCVMQIVWGEEGRRADAERIKVEDKAGLEWKSRREWRSFQGAELVMAMQAATWVEVPREYEGLLYS